jgi:hypothetical protein
VGQHFETVAVQEAENAVLVIPSMTAEEKDRLKVEARVKYAKVYMRKIVNMRLDLPKPEPKRYADLIRQVGEAAGSTWTLLQQGAVVLLLALCLGTSVAVSTGWLQYPSFDKPEQPPSTIARRSLPVEARNRGNETGPTPQGGQVSRTGPPAEKPPGVTEPEDRNASRPKEIERAMDSKPFSEALDGMAPEIQKRCGTPREVRRFQNYLRFLAAWDDSASRPQIDGLEADLVRLAATGTKSDGKDRSDIPREAIDFFVDQCKMLGLDPNTFQPVEENNPHQRSTGAFA